MAFIKNVGKTKKTPPCQTLLKLGLANDSSKKLQFINPLEEISYHHIAPLTCLFTFEIIRQSLSKNYQTIFFLARDSYLPWTLYNQIKVNIKESLPPSVYTYISRSSSKETNIDQLENYLYQQGWFNPGRHLIIDIGWKGSILKKLEEIFPSKLTHCNYDVLFFGRENSHEHHIFNLLDGFAFDSNRSCIKQHQVISYRDLFESVWSENCGSVIGYKNRNQRIVPNLDTINHSKQHIEILSTIRSSTEKFCSKLINLRRKGVIPRELLPYAYDDFIELFKVSELNKTKYLESLEIDLGNENTSVTTAADYYGFGNNKTCSDNFQIQTSNKTPGSESSELLLEIDNIINQLLTEERLWIYGAGSIANKIAPHIPEHMIQGFIDSDSNFSGKHYLNKPILPPSQFLALPHNHDSIFVAIANRKHIIQNILHSFTGNIYYLDDFFDYKQMNK